MATSYVVNAPLVVIRSKEGTDLYLYQGSPVPADVDPEHRKMLVDEGMLVKGDDASDVTPTEEPDGDVPPAKSAAKATWVAYATDPARGSDALSTEDAEAMTRDQLAEHYSA